MWKDGVFVLPKVWNPSRCLSYIQCILYEPQFSPKFLLAHTLVLAEEVTDAIQTHRASLVVSAEDHYPWFRWGRKINFCSFSSVNLNMEHVTFSYTFHLPDTHLPLPHSHLIPSQKNKGRKERKKGREGGKEKRRKENPSERVMFGALWWGDPFILFQLG